MPYAIVEDKIAEIAPQYREELLAFIENKKANAAYHDDNWPES